MAASGHRVSKNSYSLLPLVLLGVMIRLTCVVSAKHHNDKIIHWVMQEDESVKLKYASKLNGPCQIIRIPIGPDGRPEVNGTWVSQQQSTSADSTSTPTNSSNKLNTSRSAPDNKYSWGRRASLEENYKPIIGDMVIDPCQDEENRSFMECVLTYNPVITETDPDYNKGICMCYRDWSINSFRTPAYNHSLNYELESHDWFVFSKHHKECVVKSRKRCAPGGTLIVPYRCEEIVIDDKHNKTAEQRCVDSDVDPHFMICAGRGFVLKYSSGVINVGLLLIYYLQRDGGITY